MLSFHGLLNELQLPGYWREVEAPAARSRSTLRKPAAASRSERASRATVAARCGDSGRKRTLSRLCPREVIKVLTTGGSSWVHCGRVVKTTGPGLPETTRGNRPRSAGCRSVNQRWRKISRGKPGAKSRSASKVSGLFLLAPDPEQPLKRNGPRTEAHRHPDVVKPVGGKSQAGLQAGGTQPAGLHDAAFAGAGGVDPAQGLNAAAIVVAGEGEVPRRRPANAATSASIKNIRPTPPSPIAHGTSLAGSKASEVFRQLGMGLGDIQV